MFHYTGPETTPDEIPSLCATHGKALLDHVLEHFDLGGRDRVLVDEDGAVLVGQRLQVRVVPDQENRCSDPSISLSVKQSVQST